MTCETTFFRYKKGTATDGVFGWYAGIAACLGAASYFAPVLLPALLGWSLFGIPATWGVRRGRKRTKFLRHYRTRGKMLKPSKRGGSGAQSGYTHYL